MNDAMSSVFPSWGVLANGGETGECIRSHPWAETALGPPASWPPSLRHALGICLNSSSPMGLFWGPDFIVLYNDALKTLIGDKHPAALGRPAREIFAEAWPTIGPMLLQVSATGEPTDAKDQLLPFSGRCAAEECYFTFTLSPVRQEDGAVVGVLNLCMETTERVLAERALRANEARYRAFIHATSNSVFRMSADGTVLLEMSGKTLRPHDAAAAPLTTPFDDYVHPDDRSFAQQAFQDAVRECVPSELEIRAQRPDGTFGWVTCRTVPIRDELGKIIEWVGSATDITQRKRTEEALLRSEARLKAAVDLVGLSLWAWDPATGALDWDARIKAMWGLQPDAPVDLELAFSAVRPEDRPRVDAAIAAATDPRGNGVYAVEYRVVGIDDGIERWVATYGQAMFRNNQAVRLIGAALDVTDRKRAEERLRQSEAQIAAILEQLPVGVGLYDTEGHLIIGNAMMRSVVGNILPSRDPDSSRYWQSYGSDGRALDRSQYPSARALQGETVSPGVNFVRTYEDGRKFWTRVSAAPFYSSSGEIAGAVSVVQDIDDEKRAQDANLVLIAELQHRTRNLLTVVRSIANQLLKSGGTREDFSIRLNQRLGALSRVQGLLSRPSGTAVSIGELVTVELEALGTDESDRRIRLQGPEIALPFNVVQILALALHELSTNALKYGALSIADGRLEIVWRVFTGERGERRLELNWRESGIVEMPQPEQTRRGYGRELIERALPYQLGARTELTIAKDGVRCMIDLPLVGPA